MQSVPGDDKLWHADVSFLTRLLTIDDIYILRHHFPFSENLRVSPESIQIGYVESLNHLWVLCYRFAIYAHHIIRCVDEFVSLPLYWSSDNIDAWVAKSEATIEEESI